MTDATHDNNHPALPVRDAGHHDDRGSDCHAHGRADDASDPDGDADWRITSPSRRDRRSRCITVVWP